MLGYCGIKGSTTPIYFFFANTPIYIKLFGTSAFKKTVQFSVTAQLRRS